MVYIRWEIFDSNGDLINIIISPLEYVKEYCKDNDYTYLLSLEHSGQVQEPSAEDDHDSMLVDQEYRLTLLELGVTE